MLGALLAAPLARGAEDPIESVHLRYEADPGCPGDRWFTEQVLSRTSRARFTLTDSTARTVRLEVTRRASVFRGRMTIEALGHGAEVREIVGADCENVVSALALFTALAIDPTEAGAASAPGTPPKADDDPEAPADLRTHVRLGLEFETWRAGGPGVMNGGSLVASAGRVGGPPWALRGRVWGGYLQGFEVPLGPGFSDASLPNLGVSICPLEFSLARSLAFDACPSARVGVLHTSGGTRFDGVETTSAWGDIELLLLLDWWCADRLALQLAASGILPLTRPPTVPYSFDMRYRQMFGANVPQSSEPWTPVFGITLGLVWDATGPTQP